MWNMISDIKGRTQIENVCEQGVEEVHLRDRK
jgi:hypothetical protein